jgi:hypothetical protein
MNNSILPFASLYAFAGVRSLESIGFIMGFTRYKKGLKRPSPCLGI